MDKLTTSEQGNTPSLNENVITVRDATIERILPEGYVIISYIIVHPNCMISKNFVTLVIGPNTLIRDSFGEGFPFRDLRVGMIVDADFSSAMTKSIPPQSRAFKIVVSYKNMPFNAKIDRVLEVDVKNRFLYTGNADDIYSQVRFVITTSTQILDRRGNRIRLQDIRPGQLVRIAYATFMALSIPPQTTAFEIQVLEE